MEYFIFYINFEEKIIPIYCESVEEDPILEGHALFKGVKHLNDNSFPILKVKQISLPKKDIKYYLKGIELEEIEESVKVSDKSASPEKTDDLNTLNSSSDSTEKGSIIINKTKARRKFRGSY